MEGLISLTTPVAVRREVSPFDMSGGDAFAGHGLKRRVVNFLNRRLPGLAGVDIAVTGNTVVLRGGVPTARSKWVCLECCRHVAGVTSVVDELVIEE